MKVTQKHINNCTISYFNDDFRSALEKVVKNDYRTKKVIGAHHQRQVSKICIDDKAYLLKEIFSLPFHKLALSFFRKSHSLETLYNVHRAREKGFTEVCEIYGIGEYKNTLGIANRQFMLCEFIEGEILDLKTDFKLLETFLMRLHSAHIYHGDAHEKNFMKDKQGNLRAIDPRMKRIFLLNVGGHLDMHKFRRAFGEQSPYPYSKNIVYHYCRLREKKKKRLRGY